MCEISSIHQWNIGVGTYELIDLWLCFELPTLFFEMYLEDSKINADIALSHLAAMTLALAGSNGVAGPFGLSRVAYGQV